MTLKFKLMSLLALGVLAMAACEKDPVVIDDPVCGKDPVIEPSPCDEANLILPGGCVIHNTDDFNVVFLPTQCDRGNSNQIGVELDGKYYAIRCDRTGQFGSYRPGDKLKLEYRMTNDCFFATECSQPWADGCIAIYSILK